MPDDFGLAVLYSAPLAWYNEEGHPYPIDTLDFETERRWLFNSLSEARKAIKVRVEAATADHLRTLVTLGFRAIHYSGHGHPDFLAFEDGRGAMHPLQPATLTQLLGAGGPSSVEFVFVSACYSRRSGEAFAAVGVPHVIAVRLDSTVYDDAARIFARACYLALAAGKTVRQAFDGRATVSAMPGLPGPAYEAEKFLLLPVDGNHDATIFADARIGEWLNFTPPQTPNNLLATAEHFLGRQVDMQQIVAGILDGRLVTVRGAPGIGKTALATATAHYISERRLFRDGVFFVSFRGVKSADAARFAVAQAIGVHARDDNELLAALRPRCCLLVWDNCEDPLHHAPGAFRQFLSQVVQHAKEVKVLLTSRQAVGGGLPGLAEKIHLLRRLDPLDAARLFVALAPRYLTFSEVGSDDPEKSIEMLAKHPVLDFLSGHPHAISLAVPLLQDKSLDQLHNLLQTQKVDALLVTGVPEDERDVVNSFAVSLGVSINYLRANDPNAVRMFTVMGLIPAGALAPDLDTIWGEGWRQPMDALVRASLVERSEPGSLEHFTTFPFITAYAEQLLTADDRGHFSVRTSEHFGQVTELLYRTLETESAAGAFALFALTEQNLWACLDLKRVARSKREHEDISPTGTVATYLPQILNAAGRYHDGILAAERGREACRALADQLGEANTLFALGELKRLNDPNGSRRDFQLALQMFQGMRARLGEANTLLGLGHTKMWSGDPDGGKRDIEAALQIFQEIPDRKGEANSLSLLGGLKLRFGDTKGARRDFQLALQMFQGMRARLGEANCHQGLGRVEIAEGNPEAALSELRVALEMHIELPDLLGVGGDLGYMAEASGTARQHNRAALLSEEAVFIHRVLGDSSGQTLDLIQQANAFFALGATKAAMATLWQAREISHLHHSAHGTWLDAKFTGLAEQLGASAFKDLSTDLQVHGEEWRQQALVASRQATTEDTFIQEIVKSLRRIPAFC